MKKILILLIISISLIGCGTKEKIQENNPNKLDQVLEEGNYVVVDVRTSEEYNESHVVESYNIPYDEIDESIYLDKDKPVLVYCKSGERSKKAYETLKKLGYEVYDLGAFSSVDLPKE